MVFGSIVGSDYYGMARRNAAGIYSHYGGKYYFDSNQNQIWGVNMREHMFFGPPYISWHAPSVISIWPKRGTVPLFIVARPVSHEYAGQKEVQYCAPAYRGTLGQSEMFGGPKEAVLFFFSFFFSIPFIIFALLSSLPPSRDSDPGSRSRLFSPRTHYGSCLAFVIARRFQLFLASSTRVELCLPTLGALSSSSVPLYIVARFPLG